MHPPTGSMAIRDDTVTGPIDTHQARTNIQQGIIFLQDVLRDQDKRPSTLPEQGTLLLGENDRRRARWKTLYNSSVRGHVLLAVVEGDSTLFYGIVRPGSPYCTKVTPEVLGEIFQNEVTDLALIAMKTT